MNNQLYIVGGSDDHNASLLATAIDAGWNRTLDITSAHLLILNFEPDPKKSFSELWDIIVDGVKNLSCIFNYIIMFSAISENELKKEFENALWNKYRFIRNSCKSEYYCPFDLNEISFIEAMDQSKKEINFIEVMDQTLNDFTKPNNYFERMAYVLNHARYRGWKWAENNVAGLHELTKIADDMDERLNNEHDSISIFEQTHNHGEILEKQSVIDYYYLLTSHNVSQKRKYTIVCIDDYVEPFVKDLQLIYNITGYIIYYTDNLESANHCIDSMRNASPTLGGSFNRVISQTTVVSEASSELIYCKGAANDAVAIKHVGNIPDPDWIFIDLMLQLPGFSSHQRFRVGDEALKRYMERSPEVPGILLTWSEEPDVAAEALRESQAVSVVSKRRILRLPYEMENYRHKQLGEVIDYLNDELSSRMIGAIRLWRAYPGILWHGEKTVHAAEHTLEHSLGLWKLANQLLSAAWGHIERYRKKTSLPSYNPDDLFRFLMSIWLHDIGSKGSEAYQMADQVRDRHSWISGVLLHRNPELYMLRRGEEADIVELICAYHQSCAPFTRNDRPKEVVKGLFHQSLEEIEEASNWNLMEWTALLRLLDAIEHNWRRVGNEQLYKAKKATIAIDAKFYREREKVSADAKSYADWLENQDKHMRKHMSVLEVNIRTKMKGDELLFWPEYEFASKKDAEDYLGMIGNYGLLEWFATGDSILKKMKMRMPKNTEIIGRINELAKTNKNHEKYIYSVSIYNVYTKMYIFKEFWDKGKWRKNDKRRRTINKDKQSNYRNMMMELDNDRMNAIAWEAWNGKLPE